MHLGGAERVGSLQRVPSLHAFPAAGAVPYLHLEATYDLPPHNLFLILRLRPLHPHRAATAVASLRCGRPILFVHLLGGAPPVMLPKLLPWLARSEEHTSELQSRLHLVCRLLLEK